MDGKANQIDEAVELLNTRSGPTNEASVSFYHRLVSTALSKSYDNEKSSDQAAVVSMLRDVLFRVAKVLRGNSGEKPLPPIFEELLMAVHYQHMLYVCLQHRLDEMAAKCSITLLKYTDIIAADKAFYQAGIAARDVENINLAFMLLNRCHMSTCLFLIVTQLTFICGCCRYVDITEAIDTHDSSLMESGDFADADAIPLTASIPLSHYIEDEVEYTAKAMLV
jgi:intraflagellar transport protein 172